MLSDLELLNIARGMKGNDTKLAKWLQRSPAAISQWRKHKKIPALFRRLLLLELGLSGIRGTPMDNLRARQEASRMLEQIFLLFSRTQGEGEDWDTVKQCLDTVQPSTGDDDLVVDWVLLRSQLEGVAKEEQERKQHERRGRKAEPPPRGRHEEGSGG